MFNNRVPGSSVVDSIILKKSFMYPVVLFILLVLMFWIIMIFQNSNHTQPVSSENKFFKSVSSKVEITH